MSAGGGDGVAINQSSGGGLVRARAWLATAAVPGTHTHNTQQRPVTRDHSHTHSHTHSLAMADTEDTEPGPGEGSGQGADQRAGAVQPQCNVITATYEQ